MGSRGIDATSRPDASVQVLLCQVVAVCCCAACDVNLQHEPQQGFAVVIVVVTVQVLVVYYYTSLRIFYWRDVFLNPIGFDLIRLASTQVL